MRTGLVLTAVLVAGAIPIASPASAAALSTPTLVSSASRSTYDTPVTFTARDGGVGGTVSFIDETNGALLAVEPLIGGVAALTTAALAPGSRSIEAIYSSAGQTAASPAVSVTVAQLPVQDAIAYNGDPAHDSVNLTETFNPASLHVHWTHSYAYLATEPSTTIVLSQALVAAGRVFLVYEIKRGLSGEQNSYYVTALNASTGATEWTQPIVTDIPWYAYLTYDGGRVFVQNPSNSITAYAAGTGAVVWQDQLAGQPFAYDPPTGYDGVLFSNGTGGAGTLYAISEATGAVEWSATVANGDGSPPTVADSGVYEDYACNWTYRFTLSGRQVWTHNHGCEGSPGRPSVLKNGKLYASGTAPLGNLLEQASTGKDLSQFTGGIVPPAVTTTALYSLTGYELPGPSTLFADTANGSHTTWTFEDGDLDTTPVVTNGLLFVGNDAGHVDAISLTTHKRVWTGQVPGATYTSYGAQFTGMTTGAGLLLVPSDPGVLTAFGN